MTTVSVPLQDDSVHFRLKSLALVALCFHALFAMTDFGGQLKPEYGAFVATLLILFAGPCPWRELARLPATWLQGFFILFVIAHAAYATSVFPAIGYSRQLSAASEFVRLGVFSCVIGWWLSLMPRAIPLLFALMIAGLLTAVLAYMPWADLPQIWDGRLRPKLGMPENLAGQLAALGGWLALCLLLKSWNVHGRFRRRRGLMAVFLVAYVGSFCALLFSQSRGAWLAFAATVPVIVLSVWYTGKRERGGAVPWLPLVGVAAISLLLLLGARDIVAQRFAGAEQLLPQVSDADEQGAAAAARISRAVPASQRHESHVGQSARAGATHDPAAKASRAASVNNKAISVRMSLYEFGMARWRERPLLGWGLRSTSALIAGSGLRLDGQRHAHLHSAYIDALVGMGAVGVCLLGLFLALLMRELAMAWRRGAVSNAMFWMVAGCIGIVLIANGFDSLLWRYDYSRAPLEIIFGCCVAYGLIRRRQADAAR
ncbi:O-antigen ligase family protein [Luteimonas sp. SX5]|uniref:O-antigen ligase family protein n=1 Tax=Luteimonas galliterrae TaxID=2940486 RepID=A0ABT0MFB1_9GAMM|nr:O-antigen ligase family protein [Luteimonas galliterrae]MCL1633547.1 O-antigen ligase family protein [Luteimonas galliterrae]